jgi:hypothetical protein
VSTPAVADDLCAVPATAVPGSPLVDVPLQSVAQFRDGADAGLLAVRPQRSVLGPSAQDSRAGHGTVVPIGAEGGPFSEGNSSPVPVRAPGSQPPLPPPTSPAPTGSVTCGGARASNDEQNRGDREDLPVMTLGASQGIEPAAPPPRMDTVFTGRVLGGAEDPGFAPD